MNNKFWRCFNCPDDRMPLSCLVSNVLRTHFFPGHWIFRCSNCSQIYISHNDREPAKKIPTCRDNQSGEKNNHVAMERCGGKQRLSALCKVNVARSIPFPVGIRCLYVQELTHRGWECRSWVGEIQKVGGVQSREERAR